MSEYKSDWFPGRRSKEFRDHYDEINWDKKGEIAKQGKAKKNTALVLLQADETIRAVRTPIGQTFRHVD